MSREPGELKSRINEEGTSVDRFESDARNRTIGLVPIFLMLLWMEGVLAAYFWVHKIWPSGQTPAPIMAVLDLLLACTLVALSGGLGRLIFGERLPFSPAENAALQVGVGMGLLSIAVLLAGLFGFIGVWQAWAALGLGVLLLIKPISEWLVGWLKAFRSDPPSSAVEKASRLLVLFLIAIAALQALAPPLKWDSLAYHLALPQRYLEIGKIVHLSDNLFSGFPQLAEMMFTWSIALRSGSTAATLGWAVGVIAVLGMGGFAARKAGREFRWIAPAILLSGASLSRGLSWAYVDVWVLFFGLATIVVLEHYYQTRRWGWAALAGIFAGLAFSTKYTAGMILPIGVVYLFVVWNQSLPTHTVLEPDSDRTKARNRSTEIPAWSRSWRSLVIPVLLFVSASLIVVAPWLTKNYALTGNPVYPFFFDGKDMDDLRLSFYQGETYARTVFDPFLLPFEGAIMGIEGGPKFNTSISPLFLALIPGVILGWRSFSQENKKCIVRLVVVALCAWFVWASGSQFASALTRTRHYYVIFPALAVLACFGFDAIRRLRFRSIEIGWLMERLVIFVLLLVAVTEVLFFAKASPIRVLSGFQTKEDYLTEQLGWFGPVMHDINSLSRGSSVAMFWEPRSYYCMIPCSPDVILDRWWYLMRTIGDANEIASFLRSQGYSHVLIYDFGVGLVRETNNLLEPEDWEELERFREEQLRLVHEYHDAYTLYEISPTTWE
ncbi:MAG: hypothetical protein P8Z34_13865 [Anaerolineales bacterium]